MVDSAKRLVIIATVGGTLRFFSGIGELLRPKGWEVFAVAGRDSFFSDVCQTEGFVPCPINLQRRITPLVDVVAVWRLWKILRRVKPTIVHAHTPKAGLIGMLAARIAGVPVRMYTVHGVPIETTKGVRAVLLWFSDFVALLCSTNVYCVSHSVKRKMLQLRLPNVSKASILLNGTVCGVDTKNRFYFSVEGKKGTRKCIRQKFSIPEQAVVVGFVGRFVIDKGVRELVGAWEQLVENNKEPWVMMVGDVDPCGGTDHESLRAVQSEEKWIWTGWAENTAQYYSAIDFLVLPSYREGFPTVVLEAAAMETPSIVSDATGCIDSVIHNKTGLVVPLKDKLALATAIEKYVDMPCQRKLHGSQARARVLDFFQKIDVQQELINEYERAIG